MKFTKEDKIITAKEARERSALGSEDSVVREAIRAIMMKISYKAYYGYRVITHNIHLKKDEEFKKITKEVEKLGFKINLTSTSKTSLSSIYDYMVDIQW